MFIPVVCESDFGEHARIGELVRRPPSYQGGAFFTIAIEGLARARPCVKEYLQ
jgi:hypothetical protein